MTTREREVSGFLGRGQKNGVAVDFRAGGPLKPGLGLEKFWDRTGHSQISPVKNPSTYPDNEHRVVWATRHIKGRTSAATIRADQDNQ